MSHIITKRCPCCNYVYRVMIDISPDLLEQNSSILPSYLEEGGKVLQGDENFEMLSKPSNIAGTRWLPKWMGMFCPKCGVFLDAKNKNCYNVVKAK